MVKRKEEKLSLAGKGCALALFFLGLLFAFLFVEIITTW